MIGIYKITNTKNEKSYIGQSTNIEERWKQHKQAIQTSDKSWYPLARQESDGIDDFTFEVLQQCKAEELDELEDYWIKEYNSIEKGYNKGKAGFENRRFGIFKIVKVHYDVPFEIPGHTVIRNDILIPTFKLSKSGMIMWLYFRMCKNGEEMEYAPSMVIQKAKGGISDNSVRAGFQELEKNGYIVRRKENYYDFYEAPVIDITDEK